MNLFDTFQDAADKAAELTAETGETHVPNYRGSGALTPYEVTRLPHVGDDVSMCFNGDSYPMGQIEKISKSGEKITCTNGRIFRRPRKKLVDREGREFTKVIWKDGPFALVNGIFDKRNPSF